MRLRIPRMGGKWRQFATARYQLLRGRLRVELGVRSFAVAPWNCGLPPDPNGDRARVRGLRIAEAEDDDLAASRGIGASSSDKRERVDGTVEVVLGARHKR